jgi:nucleoside-diphosphate-sugar epimerase
MIIGSGFIAKIFKKKKHLIKKYNLAIYASGVSNSQCKVKAFFLREKYMLLSCKKKIKSKVLVYFSTCSIYDQSRCNSLYVKHKSLMEQLIKNNFNKYLIVRFPELIGFTSNKKNLINFLYQKIINNFKFNLWNNAKRNIIDIDHAIKIFFYFINKIRKYKKINLEINIANSRFYRVQNIVKVIEKITLKKAIYSKIRTGDLYWSIKNTFNSRVFNDLNIRFDKNYLEKVLKKYYS